MLRNARPARHRIRHESLLNEVLSLNAQEFARLAGLARLAGPQ